ncbi:MAG: Brp/Blh family beta-carotene 15,15'-dioxygenase [Candidatus Obscuribacterales bacterium]|nr:Brp/Blh family beta-carotene 15,15'-dioxygenase [Cyanobacteria bacterium HKST-UBA01]MCB9469179.1 Brp/Blh family beta-carotene 15,15'-dioxygenase [Candidatus Obscuribacterales bacterium]
MSEPNEYSKNRVKDYLPLSFMIALTSGYVALSCFGSAIGIDNLLKDVYLPIGAIAILGLSHGSLDHVVYKNRIRPVSIGDIKFGFFSIYLLLLSSVILLWLVEPVLALVAFLTISVIHFGSDDSEGANQNRLLEAFIRGMMPVVIPTFRHPDEVSRLFRQLTGEAGGAALSAYSVYFASLIPMILLISAIFIWFYKYDSKHSLKAGLEIMLISATFWMLPPLAAFCAYFCGIHAPRKILTIAELLAPQRLASGVLKFHKLSIKPTLVVIGVSGLCYLILTRTIPLDEAAVRVTFIALNALTLPHVLLPCMAKVDTGTAGISQYQRI